MLSFLPENEVLYQALVHHDLSYEGRAYVGVTSTGVFCRFTCVARKPRRENCLFYPSPGDCLAAGFRPCFRCKPLEPLGKAEPAIADLMAALEAEPGRRWIEADIVQRGLHPSTVRRIFKRHLGVTFLDLARMYRLKAAGSALARGQSVIEAQIEGGFESSSGFRSAFARVLGRPPSAFGAESVLRANWIPSPLGPVLAIADPSRLHLLEFFDRKALPAELKQLEARAKQPIAIGYAQPIEQVEEELKAYFNGRSHSFATPLALHGSPFARTVWNALGNIPAGETRSYLQVANAIGYPTSVRAVARANGANRIGIIIPCHRVIGTDGDLTGYGGGLWRKRWLLDHERNMAKRVGRHAAVVSAGEARQSLQGVG